MRIRLTAEHPEGEYSPVVPAPQNGGTRELGGMLVGPCGAALFSPLRPMMRRILVRTLLLHWQQSVAVLLLSQQFGLPSPSGFVRAREKIHSHPLT
jgi:hypothetical protein